MDWNRMEGNWKQFKGRVKEKWGRLTDDDLDVINGRPASWLRSRASHCFTVLNFCLCTRARHASLSLPLGIGVFHDFKNHESSR